MRAQWIIEPVQTCSWSDTAREKEMLYEQVDPEGASDHRQRQFAKSLVDILGLDDALQVCRDNGWYGILDIRLTEPTNVWH